MFYRSKIKDHIRVQPNLFGFDVEEAVLKKIKEKFSGYIDRDIGIIIDVIKINNIGEGVIIPGDGAAYYEVEFELMTFKPELQEVVLGRVKDIADFGAFINFGPIEGMIHISQTMDDFVSFAKDKTLMGKESKRVLKVGDLCRCRIIASSFKDVTNPKIGLTMRQVGLGRLDWLEEDKKNGKEKSV
ncbi:MAG: DNA-directed RNA polymerase [Candidatus Woesearchaeota archaeon]